MAHTFRQKSQALQQTGTTIGLNHTPGAAATVAVLSIVTESLTARTGGAPTIDGVTATQVGATQTSGECKFELWYVCKAFSGSQFATSTPNAGGLACNVSVVTADAGSGFSSVLHAFDEDQGAAGTEDSVVLTVAPEAVGDFLYARIGSDENVNTSVTAAAGTNWDGGLTLLYSDDIGNQSSMSHYSIADATGGTSTITYTFSNAGYATCAVVFKSVAGATTYTKTPSLDSYLQKAMTKTPGIDAALNKAGQTKTAAIDGYLKIGGTKDASLDAVLNKADQVKTSSLDAALNKVGQTKTTGLDGYKQQTKYIYIGTP
jgi:hypothetical protein